MVSTRKPSLGDVVQWLSAERTPTEEHRAAQPSSAQANNNTQGDKKPREENQTRSERAAMSYSEKTAGTVEEYQAMQSTVMNRGASGERQWVGKDQDVNEHNVVNAPNQYQGVDEKNYKAYLDGTAKDSGAQNAATADANLAKSGKPTTDATSFIVNPGGKAPTAAQIRALGRVQEATAKQVGDVHLYKPKPQDESK